MIVKTPLYFNWANRGILSTFPDVEWRRIPPGYYHSIKIQFDYLSGGSSMNIIMFWFNLPAKIYNVDGPSPPLPVFHVNAHIYSKEIKEFAIGDFVDEDAWIGFVLYNSQVADGEFRVWGEIEKDLTTIGLDMGQSKRSILDR